MEENRSYGNLLIVALLTVIAINLFVLDLKVFTPTEVRVSDVSTVLSPNPTTMLNPFISDQPNICPQTCLSVIREATRSGNPAVGGPETIKPVNTIVQYSPSTPREYYIPLGNGSTQSNNWDNLTATETMIDPASYGKILEAYFIASLKDPTQNGQTEAQLYNVTDKHPVWGSNVVMNGPVSQTITSGKITLDTGNKLYRVQLKNSMQYQVSLENAKIRIIAE